MSGALSLSEVLARGDVWRGDALAAPPQQAIATGHAALDAELPGGGWPCGGLTELLGGTGGIGELSLFLPALARLAAQGGRIALVAPPWQPHAPAWAAAGIAPEHLLLVQPGAEPGQGAWCLEQLLGSGGFAAVLGWAETPARRLQAPQIRRLQVATEGRPVLAVLWRSSAEAAQASAAPLRLQLETSPPPGAGRRLQVRILKRRGAAASPVLTLNLAQPGKVDHAVAGPRISTPAPASAGLALVA
ncbi:translesion DNA synthesis-associated protein ImuA [Dechloromonas sp. ZY10]|uniref:translesion DNA synthesis-associated protein ImuA n=1 Tax=Dechloromonas aquae TaxID=2664436 RepID=UPI0035288B7E